MKYLFAILVVIFTLKSSVAQIIQPTTVNYTTEKIEKNLYYIHWEIAIDSNWMIFAPCDTDEGGIPLNFTFSNLTCYDILEYSIDTKPVYSRGVDELFSTTKLPMFENMVFISHKVRIKENCVRMPLDGEVEYHTISDIYQACLPPQYFDFKISLE